MKTLVAACSLYILNSIFGIAIECQGGNEIYDCAANALYIYCKLNNTEITYSQCLELLPVSQKGNSLLEFKTALNKLKIDANARIIKPEDIAVLEYPCFVLNSIKNNDNPRNLGHYFLIIPEDKNVTIYDYPREVETFPANYLIASIKQAGITEIPVLICKSKQSAYRDIPVATEVKAQKNNNNIATSPDNIIEFNSFEEQAIGELDFGSKAEGSLVEKTFNLINNSPDELIISSLQADCKCSGIDANKSILKPKESCKITIVISLVGKYKEVAVKGWGTLENKSGTNKSNLILFVKGYSEPRLLCKPQRVDFGTIRLQEGTSKGRHVEVLKTKYSENQIITNVAPTSNNFRINNLTYYDQSVEFDIKCNAGNFTGVDNSKINIFMNEESTPANSIEVTALLKSDFVIYPKTMIIKNINEASATIRNSDSHPFKIEQVKVASHDDIFNVSYEQLDEYYQVYLSVKENSTPAKFLEDTIKIKIKMDSKNFLLTVPVIYTQ